jgi:hypothetical protein
VTPSMLHLLAEARKIREWFPRIVVGRVPFPLHKVLHMQGSIRVVESAAAVVHEWLVVRNATNLVFDMIIDEVRGRRRRTHTCAISSTVGGEEVDIHSWMIPVVAVWKLQAVRVGAGRAEDFERPHTPRRKRRIAATPICIGSLPVLGCSQKLLCPSDVQTHLPHKLIRTPNSSFSQVPICKRDVRVLTICKPEGCCVDRSLPRVIVRKFGFGQITIPIPSMICNIVFQIVSQNAVCPFSLPICLRMEGQADIP